MFLYSISVEPTMFLFLLAFMITNIYEQELFIQKVCRGNLNLTDDICDHIHNSTNAEYKITIQQQVSKFLIKESVVAYLFPVIMALFMGSFSDKFGRKAPLLCGLFGKFIYSTMLAVNAHQRSWPVETILYTATLPCALTGADVAIFASCFAYMADVSTLKTRTLRITILDAIYLGAIPIGISIGSALYHHTDIFYHNIGRLFTLNAVLVALSILYSFIFLRWQTTKMQKSICLRTICCDFFDWRHARDTIRVLIRSRPRYKRLFLWAILVAMMLYTFQREEWQYLFLFARFKLQWTTERYSLFKTVKSAIFFPVLLWGASMARWLGWRETSLVFLGAGAHIAARLCYYFAPSDGWFFVGGVICGVGPLVGPMLRAMVSKVVLANERGKVYSVLSVCDNAIPLISGIIYPIVYQATLNEGGTGVFMLTIASQFCVFLLIL